MTPEQVIDIGRDAVWLMIRLGAPSMLTALVVGIVVSLFQALTQIQETTLSFLPKLAAMLLVLVVTMPLTLSLLTDFTLSLYGRIAAVDASGP